MKLYTFVIVYICNTLHHLKSNKRGTTVVTIGGFITNVTSETDFIYITMYGITLELSKGDPNCEVASLPK